MAAGLALSVVQTLFNALQCEELKELRAISGYKSQLKQLQDSVTTIKAVLLDAEAKQDQLTREAKVWLDRLKDVVYDADDLFDNFITISQRKKQMPGGKISKKVRHFLSNSNSLIVAMSMSQEIKGMKKRLDAIASDHTKFGLSNISQPRERRQETMSYVHEHSILGRDSDKEAIVEMLVPDSGDVSFITIVGKGGLGKTALAQFVYNDDRVESAFHLKLWVCVSEEFDLKEILGKMLLSATMKGHDGLGMDELQRKVREQIQGKRYLLVLDDVWDENRNDWVQLREFLIVGGLGSRILVTTRSLKVAAAIGDDPMYELPGLTDENSWLLFKNMAYKKGQEEAEPDLVEIGKDIVEKCANNPLALRVVGSMLYGQEKSKWLLIKRNGFAKVEQGAKNGQGIMQTLKLSYHNLPSPLKSCFSFCALFPKDYDMEKERLINLWLAHSCLVPTVEGQSIEDVGEEYFSILLQRCFFQDIKVDYKYSDIVSCKMHDLMHDLAQEVAGSEFLMCPSGASSSGNIRHISTPPLSSSHFSSDYVVDMKKLRTFLCVSYPGEHYSLNLVTNLSNFCRRLRLLSIKCNFMVTLPSSVCLLPHLRYLDMSFCVALEILPNSITKLYNLQVLKLRECRKLRELPKGLSKLVSLRHLDLNDCTSLTYMPAGMDRMTCLHTLNSFVVAEAKDKEAPIGKLKDLKALTSLQGDLAIDVRLCWANNKSDVREVTNVLSKANLKTLTLNFMESSVEGDIQETLLECLDPNCRLKGMMMSDYQGVKLPSWRCLQMSRKSNSVSCLVSLELICLRRLQHLPSLSQLPHLKYLELKDIPNLDYMEDKHGDAGNSELAKVTFFPSLEELTLEGLSKLKGWWREELTISLEVGCHKEQDDQDEDEDGVLSFFPRLRVLTIDDCESMTSFPAFPHVKYLEVRGVKEIGVLRLGWKRMRSSYSWSCLALESLERTVFIDNMEYLIGLPEEFVRGLVDLHIRGFLKLWEGEGLGRYASSLRSLEIGYSKTLKTLRGGGLEHLTNLEKLTITDVYHLSFEEEGDNGVGVSVTPWKSLESLSSLGLVRLPKLVKLPEGLQHLTALHSLVIHQCDNLESIPEWLDCLSSLQSLTMSICRGLKSLPEAIHHLTSMKRLRIIECDGLTERCQSPRGEDWPKISHIPNLDIRTTWGC